MTQRWTTAPRYFLMHRHLPVAPWVLVLAAVCLSGCGRKDNRDRPIPSQRVPVHLVVGRVLVSGRPAANAMVAFHPLSTGDPRAIRPVALTNPDGTFRLMTYETGDGAPEGKYAVTVVWPDRSLLQDECVSDLAHDRFQGRYSDPARSP